jgi:tetratricopeptide (TPR) repeat protein
MLWLFMAALNLESLWNWDDPPASEQKFREALVRTSNAVERAEIQTQIARAQGLQRKFDEAHRTLDTIVTNSARAEVRCLLERGRVFNSSGKTDEARPLFLAAWEKARAAGFDFLAVDAAHMLGILDGLAWHEKAIALAESSPDPAAQGWLGSLLNNLGWTHYDRGDYAQALNVFQRDLKWFESRRRAEPARVARYSIGKTLRALGRLDEALALQREILPLAANDGFVHEEIAECLLALRRPVEAQPHFARAHELLSRDPWLAGHEAARLQRLRELAIVR